MCKCVFCVCELSDDAQKDAQPQSRKTAKDYSEETFILIIMRTLQLDD